MPAAIHEVNEEGTAVIEVAWPVIEKVKGTKEITAYVLPGGQMAHVVHKGPYETANRPIMRSLHGLRKKA